MLKPERTAGTAIALDGIAKRFGRRWTLRGLSLSVGPGEVVALVGRNGSGKTTLLRILATLSRPSRGGGTVFGHDLVRHAARVRSLVGMLGHAAGLYPDLTARENLRFAQRMLGGAAAAVPLEDALDQVSLAGHADERVRFFSAGMQRRLALARVLLRPPRLLLLDEPHSAFDREGMARVHALMRQVRDAGGVVVVATHDPHRAAGLIDRLLRLEAGVLRPTTLDELENEPGPAAHGRAPALEGVV